jgi:hypothetical protein
MGRGPDGAETALVGEGRDPREWVIDGSTGRGFMVDRPTVLDLNPTDYVIPLDDMFRGRAMGLFFDIGRDLGVPGYAGGRPPKKKPAKAKREVPARIAEGGVPFDDVENDYQDSKRRYDSAGKDVSKARTAVDRAETRLKRAKTPSARTSARNALDDAKRALKKAEGHRDRVEPTFKKRQQDYKAAKETNDQVQTLQSEINVLRDAMSVADRNDDTKTFDAKKKTRGEKIGALQTLLKRARQLANPKSKHARALNELISAAEVDAADNADQVDTRDSSAASLDDLLTAAERQRLDDLDLALAIAEGTAPIDDDRKALGDLLGTQQGILGRLQGAGAPSSILADVVRSINQTKGQLGDLTNTPDLQAQLDQANERTRVAQETARISDAFVRTAGASGDLGLAGGRGGAGGPNIVFQSYVPPSPEQAHQLGRHVTSGLNYQGARTSPREDVGL